MSPQTAGYCKQLALKKACEPVMNRRGRTGENKEAEGDTGQQ